MLLPMKQDDGWQSSSLAKDTLVFPTLYLFTLKYMNKNKTVASHQLVRNV